MSQNDNVDDALNYIRRPINPDEANNFDRMMQYARNQASQVLGIPADRVGEPAPRTATEIIEEAQRRDMERLRNLRSQLITPPAENEFYPAPFDRSISAEEYHDTIRETLEQVEDEETDEEYMRRVDAEEDAQEEQDEEIVLPANGVIPISATPLESVGVFEPLREELQHTYVAGVDPYRNLTESNANVMRVGRINSDFVAEYNNEEAARMYRTFVDPSTPVPPIRDVSDLVMAAGIAILTQGESIEVDKGDTIILPAKPVPAKYSRFKDAEWFGGNEDVLVGGAGGIGSWLCFLLSRAGFNVTVYDYDRIEAHNLSGQLFGVKQIGLEKTFALSNIINDLCGSAINNITEKYNANSMVNPYMFSCFDNMEARKIMFEKWLKEYSSNPNAIYIDGRLLFEQLTIFSIRGNDLDAISKYLEKDLFNDADVKNENCTLKQTTHSAAMIAAHMVGFFTNFLTSLKPDQIATNIPYRWEYLIPLGEVPNE